MTKEIDLKRRKPRQARGTPAYWAANRVAFGVLGFGILFGVAFHFMPGPQHYRNKFFNYLESQEEEHQLKKMILARTFGRQLRVDELKEIQEKLKDRSQEAE